MTNDRDSAFVLVFLCFVLSLSSFVLFLNVDQSELTDFNSEILNSIFILNLISLFSLAVASKMAASSGVTND